MQVPFLDLQAPHRELKTELDAAFRRVMDSGWFVLGPEVEAFEAEFAAFCGTKHCVAVSNGLEALTLILRGYGIGAGDEVVVPSHTFVATWLAVSHTGATPVPVDVSGRTCNLDPELLSAALTCRTRAVIPVHLYGHPAAMDAINAVASQAGLKVIEDAAQAHGAAYHDRRVGSLGNAAAFSFYPGKNLGACGDGGAVTTDDADLVRKLKTLRNYGSEQKYVHDMVGYNARLDELQAALLRIKLQYLEDWNGRRKALANRYQQALRETGLGLPAVDSGVASAWHLYVIRTSRREVLRQQLAAAGVGTLIHYPLPPHRQLAYAGMNVGSGSFPVADQLAEEVLSLPMGPHLSEAQANHVIAAVRSATEVGTP